MEFELTGGAGHVLHLVDSATALLTVGSSLVAPRGVVAFDRRRRGAVALHNVRWRQLTGGPRRRPPLFRLRRPRRPLHRRRRDGVLDAPPDLRTDFATVGPRITAVGDRLYIPEGQSIHVVTLSGQVQAYPAGAPVSRHLVRGQNRVFAALHTGPLFVFDDGAPPARMLTTLRAIALSASGEVLCVVSAGPRQTLSCLEQDTLRERWRAELPDEVTGFKSMQQDAERVYVMSSGRAMAFELATGRRILGDERVHERRIPRRSRRRGTDP